MGNSDELDQQKQKLVVKDRRRFDAEGNDLKGNDLKGNDLKGNDLKGSDLKADTTQNRAAHNTESNLNKTSTEPISAPDTAVNAMQIDFKSFIMSLATQALMQLGDIKAPNGVDIKIDKLMAKQTIDILIMLADKTKGNLDETEAALMDDIVHNLQLSYVNKI